MQRVSLGRAKGRGRVFTRWVFVAVAMALCAAGSAWGDPVTFYSGDIPVTLDLALDELQVRPAQPMAKADPGAAVRARLADAEVSASIDPKRLVVKLGGMAKSRAALGNAVATLRGAGFEVDAVAYPFTPHARTQEMAVLISGRVVAKFPDGADVPAILAANGLTVAEEVDFLPNTFVLQTASGNPLDAVALANGLQETRQAEWAYPETARYYKPMAAPNDPLFPQQWHLDNTGQQTGLIPGNDVNILGAWNLATGKGVNITVVDDGVEENHPDLLPNVRKDLSTNYADDSPDPTPVPFSGDSHGTAVAGMAAARGNNGLGVAGAAYEASIVGVKFLGGGYQTDLMVAKCALHLVYEPHPVNQTFVNTNSWGYPSFFGMFPPTPLTLAAMEKGVVNGRNGKGVVYLWAAGNDREYSGDVNAEGTPSSRFSIAVAATGGNGGFSFYSTPGAALLINTPSMFRVGGMFIGTTTTDLTGLDGESFTDYRDDFNGTSSSCPLAAGIVALMLEVNPNLTWRDVQHILVDTAVKNDPASPSWANNGAGKHFSHDYGFGRVDAEAAVTAALSWTNVPPYAFPLYNERTTHRQDPPIGEISSAAPMQTSMNISSGGPFHTEAVEVFVDIKHNNRGAMDVELISPSGMVSRLMRPRPLDSGYDMVWMFTTNAHWGEDPNGTWTLRITNTGSSEGELRRWYIRVHGHGDDAGGGGTPLVWSVTPETSLTATGLQNGVISPFTKSYTITNDMGSPMAWNASVNQPWVKVLAPASGTLLMGASTTVTVQFNSEASLLDPGSYNALVVFNNLTNGENTQRMVSLTINEPTGTEPEVTSATLSPASPGVSDDLTISYTASVVVSEHHIRWYRNGEYMPAYDDFTTLPAAVTVAGEIWRAEVSVSDGLEWSLWVASQSVTIAAAASCPEISAPASLTASDGDYTDRVRVQWDAVASAESYRIYRSTLADPATATFLGNWTGTVFDDFPPLGNGGTGGGDCNVCCPDLAGLLPGIGGGTGGSLTYYYWVAAYNGCAESPWSTADSGYAGSAPGFLKRLQSGAPVYERALPSALAGAELLSVAADGELALRLWADAPVDPGTVWGAAAWDGGSSDAAVWVAGAGATDGWVVLWPGDDLAPGTIVTASAGAVSATGSPVGPVTFRFLVTGADGPAAGVSVAADAPALAGAVGEALQVGPDGVYDQPATVRVPLPAGHTPETARLYYLLTTGDAPGWYPADQVAGWMVPGSLKTETAASGTALVFDARHSGLVRFAATGTRSAASGVPLLPSGAANLAVLAGAMAVLMAASRLRKPRRG